MISREDFGSYIGKNFYYENDGKTRYIEALEKEVKELKEYQNDREALIVTLNDTNEALEKQVKDFERDIWYKVFLSSGHLYYNKVDLETATKAAKEFKGRIVKYLPEKLLNQLME